MITRRELRRLRRRLGVEFAPSSAGDVPGWTFAFVLERGPLAVLYAPDVTAAQLRHEAIKARRYFGRPGLPRRSLLPDERERAFCVVAAACRTVAQVTAAWERERARRGWA